MDRTDRLLRSGYFPAELPPCFVTESLASNHRSLYATWLTLEKPPKGHKPSGYAPSSRPEIFSLARAGHQRRILSLPNPVSQTILATHIEAHWGKLLGHYRQSRFSLSRPRILPSGPRAVPLSSMQMLYERKVLLAAGYRYMLKTDISKFFPTVYTHSIPWALHGKAVAKSNRKVTPKYFGNLLDRSIRQGQEEQTIGLPIGPDTSHILAEAVAVAVDLELKKKLKGFPQGFRFVDDYFMFFSTAPEAESALATLMRALKEFELQINFEKTKTCSVLEITEDYWPHQIRNFQISKSSRRQASDIHHFFELTKNLARQNSSESVMPYALKRIYSTVVKKANWEIFEAHLCHAAYGYPNTLQTVVRILSTYGRFKFPINRDRLELLFNALISEHAPLGHHSEVAWSLWACKDLKLKLDASNVDLVAEMHSSICALQLIDLAALGLTAKSPKTTYWKQFESVDSLNGDLWLLSYEAGLRGFAGFSDSHIRAHSHFEPMRDLGITFFDQSAELSPIFAPKAKALVRLGLLEDSDLFDIEEDVDDFLDYEEIADGYGEVDEVAGEDDEGDEGVDQEDDIGRFGDPVEEEDLLF